MTGRKCCNAEGQGIFLEQRREKKGDTRSFPEEIDERQNNGGEKCFPGERGREKKTL